MLYFLKRHWNLFFVLNLKNLHKPHHVESKPYQTHFCKLPPINRVISGKSCFTLNKVSSSFFMFKTVRCFSVKWFDTNTQNIELYFHELETYKNYINYL